MSYVKVNMSLLKVILEHMPKLSLVKEKIDFGENKNFPLVKWEILCHLKCNGCWGINKSIIVLPNSWCKTFTTIYNSKRTTVLGKHAYIKNTHNHKTCN